MSIEQFAKSKASGDMAEKSEIEWLRVQDAEKKSHVSMHHRDFGRNWHRIRPARKISEGSSETSSNS